MLSLTSFEELSSWLEKFERISTPGYHQTYYKAQIERAISNFDKLSFFKYLLCTPKYRQLIAKAKLAVSRS